MNYLNKNISDYITNTSTFEYVYDDIYQYRVPYEEDIPERWYYAQIFDIRTGYNRYREHYITVYYKIFSVDEKNKYESGRCRQVKYHKIRVEYLKDSIQYCEFYEIMHQITEKNRCSFQDFKGEILGFRLEYTRKNSIGKTNKFMAVGIDEEWFDESIENIDYDDSEDTCTYDIEVDEYGNYI